MEWVILVMMLAGLATIGVALWMCWQPLAILYGGVVMCVIARAAYARHKKETR